MCLHRARQSLDPPRQCLSYTVSITDAVCVKSKAATKPTKNCISTFGRGLELLHLYVHHGRLHVLEQQTNSIRNTCIHRPTWARPRRRDAILHATVSVTVEVLDPTSESRTCDVFLAFLAKAVLPVSFRVLGCLLVFFDAREADVLHSHARVACGHSLCQVGSRDLVERANVTPPNMLPRGIQVSSLRQRPCPNAPKS